MVQIVLNDIKKSNLQDKIIISSFDWRILREVKNQSPEISRAYLTFQQEKGMKIKKTIYSKSPWIDHIPLTIVYDLPKIIKELGGSAWHPYYKDINKKAVKDAHDYNLPVNVWTVNDEYNMLKMIEMTIVSILVLLYQLEILLFLHNYSSKYQDLIDHYLFLYLHQSYLVHVLLIHTIVLPYVDSHRILLVLKICLPII